MTRPTAAPAGSGIDAGPLLGRMSFQYDFRRYQEMMLNRVAATPDDHRHHLVAPPGSGKTIVGLELIRKFGRPAVVFAPTTTIQEQWRSKVAMFLPDGRLDASFVSTDPGQLAPINVFTYQVISTPGESDERLRALASKAWIDELVRADQVHDDTAAAARLEALRSNNPEEYRREIARRCVRIRRASLREGHLQALSILHPNARTLIEKLVAFGIGTVVLDECHHLLDYWAIVLRSLIDRLHEPEVVGLTATLPSPEDGNEYENYTSLLGDVDFEVPTPAVVKEGDLAPYRDLVYFVPPTQLEVDFLERIQKAFEGAIEDITKTPAFARWVTGVVQAAAEYADDEEAKGVSPGLFVAALRYLNATQNAASRPAEALPEAREDLTLEDWAVLLERFGLDVLKTSADPGDREKLKRLRATLRDFGFTLTERGLRATRSPGDLVVSFSANKDRAAIEILAAETEVLAERLRAVVITDFEKMSSGARSVEGVLTRDAGSAQRAFKALIDDPRTNLLDPVLVTGSVVLVDSDRGELLTERFNDELRRAGLKATCRQEETDIPRIVRVAGEGPDWSSRTYVALVTRAFEEGVTRCIVGTRGILGEGWDALTLNTLIDLTSVTTATSVQQLRGRTLRKDPKWPEKVAHNWDVICVAQGFDRGDVDLRRFRRRHDHYWGIVSASRASQVLSDAVEWFVGLQSGIDADAEVGRLSPEVEGRVVKGVAHVDPDLAYELAIRKFSRVNFAKYNARMMRAVDTRARTREAWRIGEEYSNFVYSASRIEATDLKIKTVFTLAHTLKKMVRAFRASLVMGLLLTLWMGFRTTLENNWDLRNGALVLMLCLGATLAVNARAAYRIARRLLVDEPPDAILLDVGRAVLEGLKDAGLVSGNLSPDFVRVVEQPDNSLEVLLDYASAEDARLFIDSFREVFEPVLDQRYLVARTDGRLPVVWMMPLWVALRRWVRRGDHPPAHHPVPSALATRKELAEAFAYQWGRYVGGGELIYTRREPGRSILIEARAQRRPRARSLAFEVWR